MTSYQHETLTLQLPAQQLKELNAIGNGGIMFDLQASAGGRFVFSAYSTTDEAALIGFLVEHGAETITRSFFVCPVRHGFTAPTGLELSPLNVLVLPDGLLALYEVKQVSN